MTAAADMSHAGGDLLDIRSSCASAESIKNQIRVLALAEIKMHAASDFEGVCMAFRAPSIIHIGTAATVC